MHPPMRHRPSYQHTKNISLSLKKNLFQSAPYGAFLTMALLQELTPEAYVAPMGENLLSLFHP